MKRYVVHYPVILFCFLATGLFDHVVLAQGYDLDTARVVVV